jgi:DNA-binding CsgD family transcriptional regulator
VAVVTNPSGGRAPRPDAIQQGIPRLAGDVARRAFDTAARLDQVTALQDLDAVMAPSLQSLGFQNFVAVETRGAETSLIVGQPHKLWFPRVLAQGYQFFEAQFVAARAGASAVFFSDVERVTELTALQKKILGERREFGVCDGFTNSIHAPDGTIHTVVMTGSEIDVRDPDVRAAAHVLATYYGSAARRLETPAARHPPQVLLTERQRDCLSWVREGKSATDIGAILGISAYTVHEHVGQACARLGVRTRVQAVAAAIALRLIDP